MPVDYSTTVLTNRLQQVVNAIDAGSGHGLMRLLNLGGSTVSSFALSKPCAVVTNGVMNFNGLAFIDPAAVGGSADLASFEDSDGNVVIHGLVVDGPGVDTPDITLSPTNLITAGQTVAITAATITGN